MILGQWLLCCDATSFPLAWLRPLIKDPGAKCVTILDSQRKILIASPAVRRVHAEFKDRIILLI